jgi:hypothetical protein
MFRAKFQRLVSRILCAALVFSTLLMSACAELKSEVDSYIQQAKDAFFIDPGDNYNASDDLKKSMTELEFALAPKAISYPVNVMDGEEFTAEWAAIDDEDDYIVEASFNGQTILPAMIQAERKINLTAPKSGGDISVKVTARKKVAPSIGEPYYVESSPLTMSVGVYSKEVVMRFMEYYRSLTKEAINNGVDTYFWEKIDVKPGFFKQFEWAIKGKWTTFALMIAGADWPSCQIKFINQSINATKESLTYAQYFSEWYDAIDSGAQELNAAACDALIESVVGFVVYAQAAEDCLKAVNEDPSKDTIMANVDENTKILLDTANNILPMAKLFVSKESFIAIGKFFDSSISNASIILAIDDFVTVQNAFNERKKMISDDFEARSTNLPLGFALQLKSLA